VVNIIGRNDPCPCGSGKKYKKCCLNKTYNEVGKEDSIRGRLVEDLLRFFKNKYEHRLEDAEFLFWDDFIPEEHLDGIALEVAYQNFWEWIVFDHMIDVDNDKTLIDLYMENNKKLSLDEHKVLTMMKNSVISLYEVQEVFPEKGLLLKDLMMGGEYDVREKSATRSVRKWDIFATRLLLVDGQYIMSGSVFPYSIRMKQKILDDIMDEYREYQEEFPDGTMDIFLKESGDIFNFYWYFPIQNPPPPLNLLTSSGEPMLFSKAFFEVKDKDAVRTGLAKIKGFEQNQDEDDYIWYDKRDNDGDAIVLGRVEIKRDKLIFECPSKERLTRGKKLMLEALSDAVVHKIDTFQDPMEAMKSYKERSTDEPANELPMDIQQQIYTKFMQKHSEKWLGEKIPALNGKTPMQAVKTEDSRKKVIELLKSIENSEEYNKKHGRPFYDISWMWEKLKIVRE
jgi:hypothetical protein